MKFSEVLNKRCSYRKLLADKLEENEIDYILHAGYQAPVAKGKYDSYTIYYVSGNTFDKINELFDDRTKIDAFFGGKNLFIISTNDFSRPELTYQDTGCLLENMHLAATALGLGSVYLYGVSKEMNKNTKVRSLLGLEESEMLCAMLIVGKKQGKDFACPREHKIKTIILD